MDYHDPCLHLRLSHAIQDRGSLRCELCNCKLVRMTNGVLVPEELRGAYQAYIHNQLVEQYERKWFDERMEQLVQKAFKAKHGK